MIVGDVVVLRPGDRVPVDGEVIDGRSSVDESLVTGESLPVEKEAGSQVIAGTINQSGSLRFRAAKVGAETALAQIVKLGPDRQDGGNGAEQPGAGAASGRSGRPLPAHYLVLIAVGAGLITFVVWLGLLQAPLLLALTFAVTAVVIACPDALGLATPTAIMVATDLAARRGILFKQAVSLEQAARIQAIIFDKTGTLTEGRPRVTEVVAVDGRTEAEILQMVAAVETLSSHPLARAVLDEAAERGLRDGPAVADFANLAGRGIRARLGGQEILIGTRRLLQEQAVPLPDLVDTVERLEGRWAGGEIGGVWGRAWTESRPAARSCWRLARPSGSGSRRWRNRSRSERPG